MSSLIHATLRPFKDHVFYFATYDRERFQVVEYRCVACFRTIANSDHTNAEHEGYVTIHRARYTGGPEQYAWVCKECFDRYRWEYSWTVSEEKVPDISR
jgi:hypothetical protein